MEEQSDQVVAHFPPISYLLTSAHYPLHLKKMLVESLPSYISDKKSAVREIDDVISILDERKKARALRRLSVVNFVTIPEIERWLKLGVVGRFDLRSEEIAIRRAAARAEVEHLVRLVEGEPMGIQIALLEETLPNITFQLFRNKKQTSLGLSPFRLGGELPNIRLGLAMVTADQLAVELYEKLADELWRDAHKGAGAVRILRAVLIAPGSSARCGHQRLATGPVARSATRLCLRPTRRGVQKQTRAALVASVPIPKSAKRLRPL